MSNFFFSPPAHLCAVTYMTEISLIVTLNNQFNNNNNDTAVIRKQYFNCTDLKTLFNSVAGDTILAFLADVNLVDKI